MSDITTERDELAQQLRALDAERMTLQDESHRIQVQLRELGNRATELRNTLHAIDRVQAWKGTTHE